MLIYKGTGFVPDDMDDASGTVKGYASVFGNMDSDSDIIYKGAYTKTLQENRKRIKYYYQHNLDKGIGLFSELYEDEKGLGFVAKMALNTIEGKDVYEKMKFGLIDENSVGIYPTKKENRQNHRAILEVKLFEISAVSLAANDMATINSVKSLDINSNELIKRIDAITALLKKSRISDDEGYRMEIELQSLKSLLITLPSSDTKPTEPTEMDFLNHLLNKF